MHTFYNKVFCLEKITRQNRRITNQKTSSQTDSVALFKKGMSLLKDNQKYEEALKCFNEFILVKKDDPSALLYQAICLKNLNKYSEAIESYNAVIKLNLSNDPSLSLNAFFNKALCLEKLSEYEKAIECYNQVIKLDSEAELAFFKKAECYQILKKYEETNKCYQTLSRMNPFFLEFKNEIQITKNIEK